MPMPKKDLVILNNEKIENKENVFYCDNIDIKSIPEDLNKNFNVTLIGRKTSKLFRKREINITNIKVSTNIFLFLFNIYKTFKKKNITYLIISITPYTFFSYILLFLFKKKTFIYLRSDGYKEYKAILGLIGPIIYHIMFKVVTFKSNIISCQEQLFTKRKSHIVFPSEINSLWLENKKEPQLDIPRLLYVGRIKVEKGIFSLIKILKKVNLDFQLAITGEENKKGLESKKIIFYPFQNETISLINIYDKCNIFILPSFTEAHPKVIDESLARERPVIIFEDIKHIIQNREGIFVSKRDTDSLLKKINYIMKNYSKIQKSMSKNNLPTKKNFIESMCSILNSS